MTAMTFRKGIAAFCFLVGVALILVGAYYIWIAPIEYGSEGAIAITAGLLLHAIAWVLWP